MSQRCLYDIELSAETQLPGVGVFGLTGRFRRVTIGHSPPARNPRSLSLALRERNATMTGEVVGTLDIRQDGVCVHQRTYSATAKAHFGATIRLGGRAESTLFLELAPPRIIPPEWADTCSFFRQQNRDLASMMFAVGNQITLLQGPGSTGILSVGNDSFIGAKSLAAEYSYRSQRRQVSEASLASPWRELWAGRSVVIRQRAVNPRGNAVTNVRLRFTRR